MLRYGRREQGWTDEIRKSLGTTWNKSRLCSRGSVMVTCGRLEACALSKNQGALRSLGERDEPMDSSTMTLSLMEDSQVCFFSTFLLFLRSSASSNPVRVALISRCRPGPFGQAMDGTALISRLRTIFESFSTEWDLMTKKLWLYPVPTP